MATKVRMRALGRYRHDGVWLKKGDEFDTTEEDAADLECRSIGIAERVLDAASTGTESRRSYRRRDMKPEG